MLSHPPQYEYRLKFFGTLKVKRARQINARLQVCVFRIANANYEFKLNKNKPITAFVAAWKSIRLRNTHTQSLPRTNANFFVCNKNNNQE